MQCNKQYGISNNQCVTCPTGCLSCISIQVCITCTGGFYLQYNLCVECEEGCLTCRDDSTCTECTPYSNVCNPNNPTVSC